MFEYENEMSNKYAKPWRVWSVLVAFEQIWIKHFEQEAVTTSLR